MKYMNIKLFCLILVALFSISLAYAASDVQVWSGQYYTGSTYNTGTYSFNFTVYDALTGGTSCYSNTTSLTTGTWGQWITEQYNVLSSCNNNSKNYWVNINIDGLNQTPRKRLTLMGNWTAVELINAYSRFWINDTVKMDAINTTQNIGGLGFWNKSQSYNNSQIDTTIELINTTAKDKFNDTYNSVVNNWNGNSTQVYNHTLAAKTYTDSVSNGSFNQSLTDNLYISNSTIVASDEQILYYNISNKKIVGSSILLFNETSKQLTLNRNTASAGAPTILGTAFRINCADGEQCRLGLTGYGIASLTSFSGRTSRGTGASPTASLAGDILAQFDGYGRSTSAWAATPKAMMKIVATENYNDTAQGTKAQFWTTRKNSIIPSLSLEIDDGNVTNYGNFTILEKLIMSTGLIIDNLVPNWLRINGNLNVTGNMTIKGITELDGTNITGNLKVSGNIDFDGNLSVKRPYGMFSSTETQTMVSPSTAYPVTFNYTEDSYEIYKSSDNSNFTVAQSGDYLIELSAVFDTDSPSRYVELWVQKTNSSGQMVNIPRSNTRMLLPTASTEQVLAVPFIIDLLPTDTFRIMTATSDAGSRLLYITNTSYSPETPSIIMTMTKISEIPSM